VLSRNTQTLVSLKKQWSDIVTQQSEASFQCPNSSFLAIPCCLVGCGFVLSLTFLPSLWLHPSIFLKHTYQKLPAHVTLVCASILNGDSSIFCPRMPLFLKGSESHWMLTTNGETLLSRVMTSQPWVWQYRGRFSRSQFCAYLLGTPAFSQAVHYCSSCEFCLYAYMICWGRHSVLPCLRGILYLWKGTYSSNI